MFVIWRCRNSGCNLFWISEKRAIVGRVKCKNCHKTRKTSLAVLAIAIDPLVARAKLQIQRTKYLKGEKLQAEFRRYK